VALTPEGRSRLAARAAVGGHVDADHGAVGAFLNELVGKAVAGAVPDKMIFADIQATVVDATKMSVQRRGWDCHVAPVSLPPLPMSGKTDWNQFLILPSGVMIVVLRAHLLQKSAHQDGMIAELMSVVASCSVRPPIFYNNARGVQLESAIADALQRKHVASQVRVIGAIDFYEALHKDGWSCKQGAQAVAIARKSMALDTRGQGW